MNVHWKTNISTLCRKTAFVAVVTGTLLSPLNAHAYKPQIGDTFYVNATAVKLRDQPNLEGKVIEGLPIATRVEIRNPITLSKGWKDPDGTYHLAREWVEVVVHDQRKRNLRGWVAWEFLGKEQPTIKSLHEQYLSTTNYKERQVLVERALALDEPSAKKLYANDLLSKAIRAGDLEQVKVFIKSGTSVNTDITGDPGPENNQGITPLLAALMSEQPEIAKYFIEQGADVNSTAAIGMGEDTYTPLSIAATRGYTHIVRSLLAKGANPNHCVHSSGGTNGTPLIIAILNNHADIMKLLVEKGADINALGCQYGGYGATALCVATDRGPEMVEYLLAKGADINRPTENGWTPLMCAINFSNEESIDTLLKAGANVNAVDIQGRTALIHTNDHGSRQPWRSRTAEKLSARGADRNIRAKDGSVYVPSK